MTAPKKCSPRTTRFCSGTHRVYPALCFDFINHPFLFILHPILFIPQPARKIFGPRSFTQWQIADSDDCDAAAAAQRSAVTDEQLRANNLYHLNPARKIPHTTGKLRKRAPSRKKGTRFCSETPRVYPILSISLDFVAPNQFSPEGLVRQSWGQK